METRSTQLRGIDLV